MPSMGPRLGRISRDVGIAGFLFCLSVEAVDRSGL